MRAPVVVAAALLVCAACNDRGGRPVGLSRTQLVDTGEVRASPNNSVAPAPPGPAVSPALSDANIVALLTLGNQDEIAAGTAARAHAASPDVRDFAAQLVRDHVELQHGLDSAAALRHITAVPPASAETLATRMQHVRDSVGRLSGDEFDRAFIMSQVASHEKTVDDLNHFASLVTDTLLHGTLVDADHRVHAHLDRAKNLLGEVGAPYTPSARAAGGRAVRY